MDEPAVITCEITCDSEVCDPILILDIPGPTICHDDVIIKSLPRENEAKGYIICFKISMSQGKEMV